MLRSIGLKNFKCFENIALECTRLNLLCGLNGAGKSSVMQALLALRQSSDAGALPAGRLVLEGELIELGPGADILFEEAQQNRVEFSLRHESLAKDCALVFDITSDSEQGFGCFRTARQLPARRTASDAASQYFASDWQNVPPFGGHLVYVAAEREGSRKRYSHASVLTRREDFSIGDALAWNCLLERPEQRLNPDDPRCVDRDRPRLIDLVHLWLQEMSIRARRPRQAVRDAEALLPGLAFDGSGNRSANRRLAARVGYGFSYALPVILALFSEAGTLCLIEHPEAHLHPRGQTKLAELAVRAAKAGVQLFIETHSEHFMNGVRIAVREGLIAPEETAFHYFERKNNRVCVSTPQIDQNGRLSQWPNGFFDQCEENLARLLVPQAAAGVK